MHIFQNKLITTLLFLLIATGSLLAQLSDTQVLQELKRYRDAGMSQEQITLELSKKGVTQAQAQRLRDQYLKENDEGTKVVPSDKGLQNGVLRGEGGFTENRIAPEDTIPLQEKVYGQTLFANQNLTFAPNMNMPTPANYVLGAGAELMIDVWADSELNVQ